MNFGQNLLLNEGDDGKSLTNEEKNEGENTKNSIKKSFNKDEQNSSTLENDLNLVRSEKNDSISDSEGEDSENQEDY